MHIFMEDLREITRPELIQHLGLHILMRRAAEAGLDARGVVAAHIQSFLFIDQNTPALRAAIIELFADECPPFLAQMAVADPTTSLVSSYLFDRNSHLTH